MAYHERDNPQQYEPETSLAADPQPQPVVIEETKADEDTVPGTTTRGSDGELPDTSALEPDEGSDE